jgi:PAS domain S-box-containing protein
MKLVHKFTLCLISLILFSSLTGYFAIIQSKKIIHDAFINNSEILALEMLNGLERELAIMIRAFNSYSYDELIQQDLITSNREFDKLGDAQAYINNQDEEWPSTTGEKITPFIHDILNSDLSKKLKQKLAFYEQSYGYKVIGEFFITNKYGANIAQTGITSDYRQDDEDWWQIAKRDDLYIGEIDLDKSADMQSVSIGIRIEDEDYNFLGVMKVILNIEYVTQFIKEMDPPGIHKQHNTMAYKIITKEGNLIYSSTGNHKLLEHIHDILPQEHLEPEDDHNAISSMILTREEKGRELFVVHAHSKGNSTISSLGWILLVEQDSEELFAPAIELRNQILAVTLSVSLISLIIGFIISGSLTKRIQKFKNIIVTLGRGELNVNIDTGSKDELGELAFSFKQMAEELRNTTVNRDELVEEIERRKLAEASTHDNEERFRSVAENASDAIIYISDHGEVIFWNHSAENIFGYSAEEVVGKSVNCIIPERFHQAHNEGMLRVLKNGKSKLAGKSVELTATRKNGDEFPIELSISSWNIGKDVYFTGIIRDISERKHSESVINEQVGRLSALRSIDRAIIGSLDLNSH